MEVPILGTNAVGCGMRQAHVLVSLVLAWSTLGIQTPSHADEVEYDTCTCKTVQKGATSSLRGGVCVRTETGSCLMEWGAGSNKKAPQGNGLSQQAAMSKARAQILSTKKVTLEIPKYTQVADNADLLEVATGNLSKVPPTDYAKSGMLESFVLAAGTALARFDGVQLDQLADNLLNAKRKELLALVQKGGDPIELDLFQVRGSEGCLIVDYQGKVQVFVVTPYANSKRC